MLELFRLISANDAFTKVEPQLIYKQKEKEGTTMYDMVQAIKDEGFANGERQVFTNGRDSLYMLLSSLQAEGRSEEVLRALSDRSYMEQLLEKQEDK